MPITAKLSKAFYDRLGDDIANELVEWFNLVDAAYRSDLKDLNEINFARFDAKLEQRMAEMSRRMTEMEARIDVKLAQLDAKMLAGFSDMTARLNQTLREHNRYWYAALAAQTAVIVALVRLMMP